MEDRHTKGVVPVKTNCGTIHDIICNILVYAGLIYCSLAHLH